MDDITIKKVTDERVCNHCLNANFNDGSHKMTNDLFELSIGKGSYKTQIVLCVSCLLKVRKAAGNAILPGSC